MCVRAKFLSKWSYHYPLVVLLSVFLLYLPIFFLYPSLYCLNDLNDPLEEFLATICALYQVLLRVKITDLAWALHHRNLWSDVYCERCFIYKNENQCRKQWWKETRGRNSREQSVRKRSPPWCVIREGSTRRQGLVTPLGNYRVWVSVGERE